MAGGTVPPQLAAIFSAAGKANNIPANVLAGIASVESNLGQNSGPSSAGAIGMMQFLPSTARSIGVNPNDPRSAIFGAAKLLNQYGYQQNPTRAIGAYNGGPGNPQYGYAQQVLSEAKRLGGQVASGGGPAASPRPSTSSPLSLGAPQTVTQQSFDQAGYNQALGKFIAGEAVKQSGGSSNPFNVTRGTSKGFSSTLASGVGPNPLFSKGLLTTTAPNPQQFQTFKTVEVAHQQLQQLAGGRLAFPSQLYAAHAVNDAASAGANQSAQKLLGMIRQVIGGPYSQANHAAVSEPAAQLRSQGTDCSGLISWLMGPNGLRLWNTSYATPTIAQAPGMQPGAGAVITVWNNKQPGNAGHVFIQIGNQFFAAEGGVGIRQISAAEASNYIQHGSDGGTYQPLHPRGL